jgi:beta-lactam-binding protein with PASTA domain
MPDVIGRPVQYVVNFLNQRGFKVTKITEVTYDERMESGIIIKQTPSPGFRINHRNLISFEVNK